ncbi:macrolide family glycosyltransferase [Anaerosacchariphilus polymeriproducens]|uniref:Glycosyl transferase n=1 Tax=Anaerosacchariphilus polymeriproducens TaxID=1812858 RepID=A0A371AW94_9FIRM|nr:macrolide family glycosyltransferase [Anaerosacchariphilus polymeriproducens]RDU23809.1 glycosyl transferase [Anaerosacchariphilus polymeriproducens]
MEKILFLGIPAYGHINPTLGIIAELVKQGKEVVYFCSEEFRDRIEKTGAVFKCCSGLDDFLGKNKSQTHSLNKEDIVRVFEWTINSCEKIINEILEKIDDMKFDVIGYSVNFPYGYIMAQILQIPSFSSFEVFAKSKDIMPKELQKVVKEILADHSLVDEYKELSLKLNAKYNIEMPELRELFINKGDINFAYTSKYFVPNIEEYDDTFKFIGPPIYDRKEDITDFPFEEIKGKKVIYISLGTVFSNFYKNLYAIFFKAFKDFDAAVVMTAYNTDLSEFEIPENFIVRNYISQTEILKYTDVAVTHSGMNSTNDLLFNNVPFVAIPLGADQPYMASRTEKLGACISLDKNNLTPGILRDSVNKVMTEPKYIENIKKINESFKKCGGYKRAVDEILSLA